MDEPWFFPKALQKEPTRTPFGLCPNVWVDLEVINPNSDGPCDFRLRHPEQIALQLNLDKSKLLATSKLSPISDVTCAWAQRSYLHIPLDARSFAWANPIINESTGNQLYAAENDLMCFLAYGGYVYFNRRNEIVKINGVKMGDDLDFRGPFALDNAHNQVFEGLKAANRLNAVTLAGLKDHAKYFAWVLPGEFSDCPLGAFVYVYEDPQHNRYIKLHLEPRSPDLPAQDIGIQLEFLYQQPYVVSISENSPLRVCNVKRGDTILKWAENVVTNRDTFHRIYQQAKYDKAVTLVVRHAEQVPTEISYCFFRMKSAGWAEHHFEKVHTVDPHFFGLKHDDSGTDLLSRWLQPNTSPALPSPRPLSGISADAPRSPGLDLAGLPRSLPTPPSQTPRTINFLMPALDADSSESRVLRTFPNSDPPKSPAGLGCRALSHSYSNATIDATVRDDDMRVLELRIAPLQNELFEIRFPRYTIKVPCTEGIVLVEGKLSPWTTVNIGLEEQRWILPSSNCFAFAYPPEDPLLLDGVSFELQCFLRNGAWLYFDEDELPPDNGIAIVTQAMAVLGMPSLTAIPLDLGFTVTMELVNNEVYNKKDSKRLMLAANTLMKQEEFQRVPMESTWLATGRKGPDYMAWTPPFGFGNEDDFRHGGFVFYFSDDAGRRSTFFKFTGRPDLFRPSNRCSAEEFNKARQETSDLLRVLKDFDRDYNVVTGSGERWSLATEVPYQLRVATAMLAAIGRQRTHWEVVTGKGHYEFSPSEMQPPGVPHVKLDCPYPDVPHDVILDADRMTTLLEKYHGPKEFNRVMDSLGWTFQPKGPDNQPQVNLSAWYSASEAPSSVPAEDQRQRVQDLIKGISNTGFKLLRQWLFEASIRLPAVSTPLKDLNNPVLADMSRFSAEDRPKVEELVAFPVATICSTRRVTHLRELYGPKTWRIGKHHFREIEASTRIYTSNLLPGKFFRAIVKIIAAEPHAQFWKEQSHQSFNDILHMVNLTVPEKYKKSLEELKALLNAVRKDVIHDREKYGFHSEEDFSTMLNTSICSLATSVCVAQRGYCLLDDNNQLQERPPAEIVFLSACAPDFLDPDDRLQARQELQKYFVPPNKTGKWRSHGEYHGRSALLLRIMDIWHRIFTACKDLKVTHPSLLPMGLGIFRPKVAEEDAILLYFEAQLTVLEDASSNYGFETVFLNPGGNKQDLLHVLSRKRWRFPFHLQVHSRDAKSLANTLAKEGKRSCILIPADFLAVLQGLVGSWWECGHNERYTGESHIVSTSTAVLARKNISAIWNDDGHIQMVSCPFTQLNQTIPVCSYVVKGIHNRETPQLTHPVVMTFAQIVFIDFPQWWGKTPAEEPECMRQVTALLRRSQWGAIDVKMLGTDFLRDKVRQMEAANGNQRLADPGLYGSGLREVLFGKLLDISCKEGEQQVLRGLEDLNAVVIRLDFNLLKQQSFHLALLLAALLDLRVKSLFHGVIMCACVDVELRALEVRHVMHLGADWVFPYDSIKENYPVQQTFERFMKDLSRLQRQSPALTQAVYEGRVQVVRKLLVNGADPDHIQSSTGPWAAAHWVHSGHLRNVRGEKKVILAELRDHGAQFDIGTLYPRCKVRRGTTPTDLENGRSLPDPAHPCRRRSYYRLWGLWVTLDAQMQVKPPEMEAGKQASSEGGPEHAGPRKWVDMDRSPVARLRWNMMNHYSLDMWQVHLSNYDRPTQEHWAEWLPNTKEYENSPSTMLSYLRYIVVEVVAPMTTVGVVNWMDSVVSDILTRLYTAHHPTDKEDDWKAWIATSVIVHVHNASVLDGVIKHPQLYYRGPQPWAGRQDEEPVWITKSFPLSKTKRIPLPGPIDLCISSRELHDRLERATVHWLVVTEEAGLELPIQHYNMAFCMELEKKYGRGLHVVEKGSATLEDGRWYKIQVNLNLMVEVTIDTESAGSSAPKIVKVRKVVRMPDHVCVMDNLMETPHLLQEIRSSNCLLFLGAGFSFPARLPGWSQLLVAAANVAAGFVSGQQQAPYLVSRDAHAVSEPVDNNQVKIKIVTNEHAVEPNKVLAEIIVLREKILSMSEEVKQLVKKPLAENLEMAAQLLEDSCGDVLKWLLKGMLEICRAEGSDEVKLLNGDYILSHSDKYKEMAARLLIVKHLPVSGILTTNYDQLLCFCDQRKRWKNPCSVAKGVTPQTKANKPQYLNMIRNREKLLPSHGVDAADAEENEFSRPVIQIHGSTSDPQSIVLTREGYRSLLHLNPAYSNFLKTVMARSTLLYMGFSFTDGYFNEIRSELMTLQEKPGTTSSKAQPFSYAVIDDKPQPVRDFYNHHEGVHLFSWQAGKYGYGVMDRYLECLLRCTHLAAALSQCKVLLFNPQTSPLFLTHGQEVEVVNQKSLLNDYLPYDWVEDEHFTGHVLKAVHGVPLEDYLLVRLKEPLTECARPEESTVFSTLLGPASEGRAFFIPRRFIKAVDQVGGEIQEDTEVHVLVEMLRNQVEEAPTSYQLGIDIAFVQYLVPFGLRILDTRCYAVELDCGVGGKKVRLLPHKLLRLKKMDRFDARANATPQQPVSLDLTGIARRVAEETTRAGCLDPVVWANNIQKSLHQVQASYEDSLAQNSKAMDHTMETIAETLTKQVRHPLYESSMRNVALKGHFQQFILHSNITALALLKSELVHTNCIKTFIIINAANNTAPPRAHVELFRHLYHSASPYLQWAYPPRVIVHTGDSNIEGKYEAVFSEYSLWTSWVSYASTVQGVMEEIQKPVSSKSTNLPVVFRGRGAFTTNNYPEFHETVEVLPDTNEEQSRWPIPPIHTLSLPHLNGRQHESALPFDMCSYIVGRLASMRPSSATGSRQGSFTHLLTGSFDQPPEDRPDTPSLPPPFPCSIPP